MKKQENGITLIALVVTIIVLLILAGIAISLTIGNNGLFVRAQNAANTWRKAEVNEQAEMENFEELYDNTVNDLGLDGEKERKTFTFTIDGVELTAFEGDTWYTWLSDVKNGLHPSEFSNDYYELVEGWILWADEGMSRGVFCKIAGLASGAKIYYDDGNGNSNVVPLFEEKIRNDLDYALYYG